MKDTILRELDNGYKALVISDGSGVKDILIYKRSDTELENELKKLFKTHYNSADFYGNVYDYIYDELDDRVEFMRFDELNLER